MNILPFLPEHVQEAVINEGVNAEKNSILKIDDPGCVLNHSTDPVYVVEFTHLNETHSLNVYLTWEQNSLSSLITTTSGETFIVINVNDFKTSNYLLAIIAHEIGPYQNNHHNRNKLECNVSLYKEEIEKAYASEDNDEIYRLTTKAVAHGAYLNIELEADIAAIEMVGFERVICMHLESILTITNFVTMIEKQNRIRKLYEIRDEIKVGKDLNIKDFREINK